jgi:hypothetical protein
MTLIATATLASDTNQIQFLSIPQTYTDLYLVSSLRSNRSNTADDALISFNAINTSFTWRVLQGNGSSASSASGSNNRLNVIGCDTTTSNTFTSVSTYIPNYTGSTNKSYSSDSAMENNSSTSYQELNAALWSNTAAITSITLNVSLGTAFKAGSTASLYGILKGSGGATVS